MRENLSLLQSGRDPGQVPDCLPYFDPDPVAINLHEYGWRELEKKSRPPAPSRSPAVMHALRDCGFDSF